MEPQEEPIRCSTFCCRVVESFADFAQDTTAHGVKFFFQGKKLSRVAFFIVWLSAVMYTCYTCYKGITDYRLRPTGTKFEVEMVDEAEISFPTITLCNINKIRKDYLDKNPQISKMINYFNQLEIPRLNLKKATNKSKTQSFFKDAINEFKNDPAINTTLQSIYVDGGPLPSDVIICKVGYKDCSEYLGEEVFERVVSHQGNCFKLNPKGQLKADIAGNLGGITLFMHAQHSQYSLIRLVEPSEGFKISFHDSSDEANVGNTGFVVSPGLQYFIQLSYTETNLLESPYGDCLKDDKYRYTKCMHHCILAHVRDTCDCIPYRNKDDIHNLRQSRYRHEEHITGFERPLEEMFDNATKLCTLKDMFTCVIRAHSDIVRNSTVRQYHCKCPKSCQIKEYEHSVSSSLISKSFITNLLKIYNQRSEDQEAAAEEQNEEGAKVTDDDGARVSKSNEGTSTKAGRWGGLLKNNKKNDNNSSTETGTEPALADGEVAADERADAAANDDGTETGNEKRKIFENLKDKWSAEVVKENVVVLKIAFPSIEKHTVNQVVTYGLANLLGDIGGVLGLFLGGSIFTVLEFLDYIIRMIHENIVNFRMKRDKERRQRERDSNDTILKTLNKEFTRIPLEEDETCET